MSREGDRRTEDQEIKAMAQEGNSPDLLPRRNQYAQKGGGKVVHGGQLLRTVVSQAFPTVSGGQHYYFRALNSSRSMSCSRGVHKARGGGTLGHERCGPNAPTSSISKTG